MACPCCGPPSCCATGVPVVTVTVSGGGTGEYECGPDFPTRCNLLNGTYILRPGPAGESVRNDFILRGQCPSLYAPGTTTPAITVKFLMTSDCRGQVSIVQTLLEYNDPAQSFITILWQTNWTEKIVDPVDGCVISGSGTITSPGARQGNSANISPGYGYFREFCGVGMVGVPNGGAWPVSATFTVTRE